MKNRNPRIQDRRDISQLPNRTLPWGYLALTIFCAALIATGFFFAGLQHFQTIDLGIKNADLREEEEELRAEKRRLIFTREIALSPHEIARTAKRLGFEAIAEPFQPLSVAAKPNLEPSAKPFAINVKSTDERNVANTTGQVVSGTALIDPVVPAKKLEPKTSPTTLSINKAVDVNVETRPRRIVEIRTRQSTVRSPQSGLR